MSVVSVVKVSEGLVLGADSAATILGRLASPDGIKEGILKTFLNARKLLQIGDFPIGVLTWGTAVIGMRTIENVVREWEYNNHWQTHKTLYHETGSEEFRLKDCAEGLCIHLSKVYDEALADVPDEERPLVGMIVAGYSHREFFPEIWRFVLPPDAHGKVHDQRPDKDGKPDFGASWFGLTDQYCPYRHK